MAIMKSIFPIEILSKITKYMNIHDIKRVMESSERIRIAIEKNPVIWKQKLKQRDTHYANSNYLAGVKREHITTNNWIKNKTKYFVSVDHFPNTEITKIKIFGDIIVVSSNSPYVHILDKSLHSIRTLNNHKGSIWVFDYANNTLVTGSTDRTGIIWDAFLGVCLRRLVKHKSTVRSVLITDEYVITGSRDSTVYVWSIKTGACKNVLTGHTGSIRDMVLVRGRPYLVTGSYDGSCILWNYLTGEGIKYLIKLSRRIYRVESIGNSIAVAGMDQRLYIVSLDSKVIFMSEAQGSTIFQIRIDSEEYVYTLTVAGILTKYDIRKKETLFTIDTETKAVDFSVINHLIIIGLIDRIDIYCRETGRYIRNLVIVDSLYSIDCNNSTIVYGYKEKGRTKISIVEYEGSSIIRK